MAGSISNFLLHELLDHVLRNAAYTAPATVYLGISTTIPTDASGFTEATGGGYARQSIAFDVAASRQTQNTSLITFPAASADWSAGATMVGWGLFDAVSAGNMLFHGELLAAPFVGVADPANEFINTGVAHGYVADQRVQVEIENGVLPTPLVDNTDYYIKLPSTFDFQLAATAGGAAINLTIAEIGTMWVAASYKQPVLVGNTFRVPAAALRVRVRGNLTT